MGKSTANFGADLTLAGGALIAGGAIASTTGVGATVGAPAMAAGATAAELGSTVTLFGLGMQTLGGVANAYLGNSQSLTTSALHAGAAGLNALINRYFPNLPDLFPIDPLDAAADRLGEKLAGENRCP